MSKPVPVIADESHDHPTHTRLLRQVGWIGHSLGNPLYRLAERPAEPGGFSPVYIEVGDDD